MGGVRTYRDRGQLILVGALALAIVLVGLALVLNSAIYAENFATRANQGEAGQITALEQEAVQGAGAALEHHHHDPEAHASYDDLNNSFETSLDSWSGMTVRDSARQGQYVNANYTRNMTKGTRIVQDDGSTFEPKDPEDAIVEVSLDSSLSDLSSFTTEYWAVTPGASSVRDFTMTVDHAQLGGDSLLEFEADVAGALLAELELNDGELGLTDSVSASGAPFTVVYDVDDDDTIDYSFSIYRSSDDDVKITSHWHDSEETRTCTIEDVDSTFTVDISNGRVEGADGACSDVFAFQSEISDPYQLFFVEGDKIGGDYELIVDKPNEDFEDDYESLDLLSLLTLDLSSLDSVDYHYNVHNTHDDTYDPSSPYLEPAIYSAEVRLTYRSDATSYNGTRTVAPNEP